MEARIDHVVKIQFSDNKFSGVHSIKAIGDHPHGAKIQIDKTNQTLKSADKPYEAKIYANDASGVERLKFRNGGKSTFFPDSWDKARILEEVEHAVKNNRGRDFSSPYSNEFKGFSKDGSIQINFYYNETTDSISSYFPKLINSK